MIELADLFIAPLQGPVDPSKRLFWMFLLSSTTDGIAGGELA